MNYTFTNEDVELVEKFIDIRKRGYYADGKQVTDTYNRVLNKKLPPTNCSSCISQRISELEFALNHFKERMKNSGFTEANDYINEVEAVKQELNETKAQETVKERMARVRAAKKQKK